MPIHLDEDLLLLWNLCCLGSSLLLAGEKLVDRLADKCRSLHSLGADFATFGFAESLVGPLSEILVVGLLDLFGFNGSLWGCLGSLSRGRVWCTPSAVLTLSRGSLRSVLLGSSILFAFNFGLQLGAAFIGTPSLVHLLLAVLVGPAVTLKLPSLAS